MDLIPNYAADRLRPQDTHVFHAVDVLYLNGDLLERHVVHVPADIILGMSGNALAAYLSDQICGTIQKMTIGAPRLAVRTV